MGIKTENGSIGGGIGEVRVLVAVSSGGETVPHTIGREPVHGIRGGDEVSFVLGHLSAIQEDVSVGANRSGPFFFWEHGAVSVQEEGKVILDEVLSGNADVDGVPVVELALELLEGLAGDVGLREGSVSE